ncbi:MAG: VOC family protein [Chromatiaceae bacterium]|nr:VOC family protein [Chromatiaceae bacterium]
MESFMRKLTSLSLASTCLSIMVHSSTSMKRETLYWSLIGWEFRTNGMMLQWSNNGRMSNKVTAEGSGFEGFSLAHNVPSEYEVDEVVAQAVAAGARLVKKPQKVVWGGYSGYFKDLDGHLWEVAHNPLFWVGPSDESA